MGKERREWDRMRNAPGQEEHFVLGALFGLFGFNAAVYFFETRPGQSSLDHSAETEIGVAPLSSRHRAAGSGTPGHGQGSWMVGLIDKPNSPEALTQQLLASIQCTSLTTTLNVPRS